MDVEMRKECKYDKNLMFEFQRTLTFRCIFERKIKPDLTYRNNKLLFLFNLTLFSRVFMVGPLAP